MNRLIATRSDDGQYKITDITFPYIKKYAEKCNADFIVILDPKGLHIHYRILQFYELFDHYDRILSLDSDILIMKNTPDIFEEVPYDKVGTILEDVGSRKEDRQRRLVKVQEKFGDIGLKSGYINTGVALFSKPHKVLFEPKTKEELWMDLGYDDVLLSYLIYKNKIPIHELDFTWNHMSMFSENNSSSRFDSKFIHYAGQGGFLPRTRIQCMEEDLLVLKKYGMI